MNTIFLHKLFYHLFLVQNLYQGQEITFFVGIMHTRTQITAKHNNASTKSITRTKFTFSIESNAIPRIFLLINISIFSQSNSSKQTIFQYWISADVVIFTYLLNNVYINYFSMIICDSILLQTASIQFYSYSSTITT